MSLNRLHKITLRLITELLHQVKFPSRVVVLQKTAAKLLQKVGVQSTKAATRQQPMLKRTLLRGFQRAFRQYSQLLRPFTTLHNYHQRLQQFDASRRRGFTALAQEHQPRKPDVLERIRHIFGTNVRYNQALAIAEYPNTLSGYEIGENIACGCNGAVYQLRLRMQPNGQDDEEMFDPQMEMDTLQRFPLALKLMFNYQYNAPEFVLWRDMGPELIPLCNKNVPRALRGGGGRMANIRFPRRSHPNLIKMHTAFIDEMPILADSKQLYPDALPHMEDFEFLIRKPETLFIVMKRYQMALQQYVATHKRNFWVGRVMFGQLLEAIVFLHQNQISHRDMKSNNILLNFDHGDDVPHLVLSDFGSALAIGTWKLPFHDEHIDLGGNVALRAPEVRRARPGPGVVVDYEMADTWAAGTLGYEIFTSRNPFYLVLNSELYTEADLPPLPDHLIEPLQRVITEMCRVSPAHRPKPETAANVLALSLFRFDKEIQALLLDSSLNWYRYMERNVRSTVANVSAVLERKIQDITGLYATETILGRLVSPSVISRAELQLRATFLARVNNNGLRAALDYFFQQQPDDADGFQTAGAIGIAIANGARYGDFIPHYWSAATLSNGNNNERE